MPTTGLVLDSGLMTSLSNTTGGIVQSILNMAPELIFAGLGVRGVLLVINKIPGWFKRLVK